MISNHHKALVQQSFESDRLQLEAFIPDFYDRFFQTCPELRAVFPQETSRLEAKMLAALTHIAEALEDSARLDLILRALGDKHHQMQISDDHFRSFIQSFTGALAHLLQPDWSEDDQEAWTAFFTFIGTKMQFSAPETNR